MRKWDRRIATCGVIVVAGVAATLSYDHMRFVAEQSGETWGAYLVPLSIDGMLITSTLAAWSARSRGERIAGMTKLSLAVGLIVSLGANVLVPFIDAYGVPDYVPPILNAWPPVALALAFEELLRIRGSGSPEVGGNADDLRESTPREPLQSATASNDAKSAKEAEPEELPDVYEHVRAKLASGEKITGTDLGVMYGRSDRWGRNVIAEVRDEQSSGPALKAVE